MRIIGTIEHPQLKISVFKNDGRTSVKFENPLYEQTYKLGQDDRFTSVEDVQKLVDEDFVQSVLAQFQAMHQTRTRALVRFEPAREEFFEEII